MKKREDSLAGTLPLFVWPARNSQKLNFRLICIVLLLPLN
jgi:hypothetical protein